MQLFKQNSVTIGGHVASTNIFESNGFYGTITVAVDGSYLSEKNDSNGQDKSWVEKTHFIKVKVNQNFTNKLKSGLEIGGQIMIEASLEEEKWKDKESGANRSELKLHAKKLLGYIGKTEVECLKNAGLHGKRVQTA